ncbi:hypothetical protein B0H14DRAFT_2725201 [Mycena olivaceomarginata]|nr:hypothetical protein B0H14DRAFT_2725201 [Mycena olivaceomarginata]
MQLPQELFDAIVQNIDDHPTLQSCALAGPQLRDPSQRILLQSVTLRGGGWVGNYPTERAILQHSPHIATYITDLNVYISGRPGPQQVDDDNAPVTDIQWILDRLHNVRRCVFGGIDRDTAVRWTSLPFVLASAYLGFISRQSLRKLTIENIRGLPPDALPALVRPASTLSFMQMHVIGGFLPGGPHDAAIASQVVPGVLCLDLGPECQSLCRVLARPQYAAWTSLLTHLTLQADDEIDQENRALIGNAALTLQSLRVAENRRGAQHVPWPLPPLPALRALQYDLSLSILNDPQFVPPFLAILAPAARPRLSEITLILKYANPSLRGFPPCIRDPAIGALDAALAVHPARPALKLVWRVSLSVRGFTQRDITGFFHGFVRMVRGALPGAHAQGQLVFELGA